MMNSISRITKLLFLLAVMIAHHAYEASEEKHCKYIITNHLRECVEPRPPKPSFKSSNIACTNETGCKAHYNLSIINYWPFSMGMPHQISEMLGRCCGDHCITITNTTLSDITKIEYKSETSSDIIFPVLARSTVDHLHGYWYMSLFDAPVAFYVVRGATGKAALASTLSGLSSCWPLLCVGLVFALIAGFLAWIMDTWNNQEEFPRPFLIGLFEGFWWSFITMTTVGYGDKAPKSYIARLFAIGWILCGITIFSMLTASLTNVMDVAETHPSTHMKGKKVGALRGRYYDASVVAKHGGILRAIDYETELSGVEELFKQLTNHSIDGLLLDKHTYYAYAFFLNKAAELATFVTAEKSIAKEKLSFGALFKDHSDYAYFKTYIKDNWLQFDSCQELFVNGQMEHVESEQKRMFSIDNGIFVPMLTYAGICVAVIAFFGAVFEIRRIKMRKNLKAPLEKSVEENGVDVA